MSSVYLLLAKVTEATNNEKWGPTGAIMAEIAAGTFHGEVRDLRPRVRGGPAGSFSRRGGV